MFKRLQKKFIRIATLAVTLVLILLCLIVNIANYISTNSQLTQMLSMISQNHGMIPSIPFEKKPNHHPHGPFTPETPFSTRYFVLHYTDNGTLSHAELDKIASITAEDTDKYLEIAIRHGEGFGYTSGYKYYVTHTGENHWMAVFLDCYQQMHTISMTAVFSFIAMVVCIALVYIIVVLCSRRAIEPVIKSTEQQKQFITDASHELKTPITVIATSLKVLEMETGKQKWIDKARTQTEKLKELVNSLVTLSQMDEEVSPLRFGHFNISNSATETAESFRDFMESKGHTMQLSIVPDIIYYGDEYSIRQLVSILLDNAIKYTVDDTPVSFSLKKGRKGVIIYVTNECSSMEPDDLDKLFDRFYRADKSRASKTGGFGIGLSIAKSITEGHKGSICAKCENGHTITFIAELK